MTEGAAPAPSPMPQRRWWVAPTTYLATVFVLVSFNFAIPRLMPGDPIDALMAFGSTTYVQNDQTRAELARYYGLDKSLPQQYVHYLRRLAKGDLGVSIYNNVPVRRDLGGKVGWSFLLIVTATGVAMLIGLPLGVHSGWKRGKRVDRGLLAFFLGYQNLPIFVVGAGAFVLFSAKLGLFPYGGGATPFNDYGGFAQAIDLGRHLALPALLMGLDAATYQYLVMRSSMVGELGADYLLVGRAKGLRERRLKYGYAGRNALLPVVSVIGLQFGLAITSVIFIERIFAYPGIGNYMFESVAIRDYPAMQGAFLVLTITVVTVNLFVDVLYRRLDPRTAV
ncbi:MAG TPA: ABC transporter permease [Acidimicrobiales bacterium]|nr:ABC transporter permease [Acidimicrobiales bacterium]